MRLSRPAVLLPVLAVVGTVGPAPVDASPARTRPLPESATGVEPSLAAAAAARGVAHALVRTGPGARAGEGPGGVRLLHPIGQGWWIASVPASALPAVGRGAGIEAAWALRPEDRTDPSLAGRRAPPGAGPAEVRVKVFADVPFDAARSAAAAAGLVVTRALPRLGVLDGRADATAVQRLAALDAVRWIEPAPPAPSLANNGMRVDAHVNEVQLLGLTGAGVVAGMWDGGAPDASHPDLAGRVTAGESGMFVLPHSTHVAGILAGDGTNSLSHGGGGLQWRGVATQAAIVAYDVPDVLAEIDSAIALHDIDVSNHSWTAAVDSTNCALYGDYAADAPEFDAIVRGAYGKPLPVVFAAGNERDDADCAASAPGGYGTLPPPGTAKNVLTVGANQSDAGVIAFFSSWGPTDDGRMKPDVTAPGCQASGDFGITSTAVGGGYYTTCGTSQAAPAVTGALAVLVADWRAFHPADPRPATGKALLGGFAQDRGPAGPDYRFGLGAIHLEATVAALRTATTIEDAVDDGGADEWTFFVPAGTDTLRVTLAWDDPPAAELAVTTLVNDLDLELESPAAVVHLPFVLDPANPSLAAGTGVNHRDNLEQVRVLAPASGTWTARVRGGSVPMGPQEYSLAGFDARPPADPASFAAASAGDTTVTLTWIRPGDVDRAGTLVVRSAAPIAWTPQTGTTYAPGAEPAPGVFVVAADDTDRSATPLADAPLAPGTLWHYAAFAYDEAPNYSPGVADTASTTSITVAAPEPAAPAAAIRFARAGANPASGACVFRLELPARAALDVTVHDARGRRVTTLARGERDAGSHVLTWDGRDADGRPAASGVYFVRLTTAGLTAVEKVVRVR